MKKVLYRNTIEHKYSEINNETILYLVKSLNSDKYYLKAMHQSHIHEMCFDPETLATEYWPINLEKFLQLINNENINYKLFFYAYCTESIVLSNQAFTKSEVQDIFKIDPVTERDNISSNTNIIKSYCNSFNNSKSEDETIKQFIELLKSECIHVHHILNSYKKDVNEIKSSPRITDAKEIISLLSKLTYTNKATEFIKNRLLAFDEAISSISQDKQKLLNIIKNEDVEIVRELYNEINKDINTIKNSYTIHLKNNRNTSVPLLEFNVKKRVSIIDTRNLQPSNQEINETKPLSTRILSLFKQPSLRQEANDTDLMYPYNRTRVHI